MEELYIGKIQKAQNIQEIIKIIDLAKTSKDLTDKILIEAYKDISEKYKNDRQKYDNDIDVITNYIFKKIKSNIPYEIIEEMLNLGYNLSLEDVITCSSDNNIEEKIKLIRFYIEKKMKGPDKNYLFKEIEERLVKSAKYYHAAINIELLSYVKNEIITEPIKMRTWKEIIDTISSQLKLLNDESLNQEFEKHKNKIKTLDSLTSNECVEILNTNDNKKLLKQVAKRLYKLEGPFSSNIEVIIEKCDDWEIFRDYLITKQINREIVIDSDNFVFYVTQKYLDSKYEESKNKFIGLLNCYKSITKEIILEYLIRIQPKNNSSETIFQDLEILDWFRNKINKDFKDDKELNEKLEEIQKETVSTLDKKNIVYYISDLKVLGISNDELKNKIKKIIELPQFDYEIFQDLKRAFQNFFAETPEFYDDIIGNPNIDITINFFEELIDYWGKTDGKITEKTKRLIIKYINSSHYDYQPIQRYFEINASYYKTEIERYILENKDLKPSEYEEYYEKAKYLPESAIKRILNNPKLQSQTLIKILIRQFSTLSKSKGRVFERGYQDSSKKEKNYLLQVLKSDKLEEMTIRELYEEAKKENNIEFIIMLLENAHISMEFLEEIKKDLLGFQANHQQIINLTIERTANERFGQKKQQEDKSTTQIILENILDGITLILGEKGSILRNCKKIFPNLIYFPLRMGTIEEELTGGHSKPDYHFENISHNYMQNSVFDKKYPPKWYYDLCELCDRTKEPQLLYIDNVIDTNERTMELINDIIENRHVPGNPKWKLPPNCVVVLSGEISSVKNSLDAIKRLRDSVDYCIELPFDKKEWISHSLSVNEETDKINFHPKVLSFIAKYGEEALYGEHVKREKISEPDLTPKRWEKLSQAIYKTELRSGEGCLVSDDRIHALIGKSYIAQKFIEHYKKPLLDLNKIESNGYTENDFKEEEDKYYAIAILCQKQNEIDPKKAEEFIRNCLGEEYLKLYQEQLQTNKNKIK